MTTLSDVPLFTISVANQRIDSWLKLDEIIKAKKERLYNIILADDGPKRVPNAKAAMLRLIETLRRRIIQERAA